MGILLLPHALASPAQGTFVSVGAAHLPPGADIRFTPLLTALNATDGLHLLSLHASAAVVHVYEAPFTEASILQVTSGSTHQRFDLEDATMTLLPGNHRGMLVLYKHHEGAARFTSGGRVALHPQERADFTAGGTIGASLAKDSRDERYTHTEIVTRPHIGIQEQGALSYEGPGLLKIYGPDILLRAGGVERVLRTGLERGPEGLPREGVRRWVVVEFSEAAFEASSAKPWILAGIDVSAAWDGGLAFHPVSGSLRSGEREYAAIGKPATLLGTLTAALDIVARQDHPLLTSWRVSGILDKTSLEMTQMVPAAPAGRDGGWQIVAGILAGMCVVGGYGAVHLHRHPRRPGYAATAEECHDAATAAASHEDWPEAAEWFARARRLAPTSARLCADLAFALGQMGDLDEALRLYEEASRLSSDGEADLNGALTALEAGRNADEVEQWLVRCLERSPETVLDLEGDDAFAHLRGRPGYEAALTRAWRGMGTSGFGVA